MQHVLDDIKKNLGELAGPVLTTLYFDSYEAGVPTWTPRMAEEFQNRRGYNLKPWLPTLDGLTLGSKGGYGAVSSRLQANRAGPVS